MMLVLVIVVVIANVYVLQFMPMPKSVIDLVFISIGVHNKCVR